MDQVYNALDDEWIRAFETTDKLYQEFYKDDVYYTHLRVLYINRNNEIDKIKHETVLMQSPNKIVRDEMLEILKRNAVDNARRYSLLSILRYNLHIDPEDIQSYLTHGENKEYLSVIKHIDTVAFDQTITMFQDLNDLILIFYEKSSDHNCTKKVFLRSNANKKTIKKRYKD